LTRTWRPSYTAGADGTLWGAPPGGAGDAVSFRHPLHGLASGGLQLALLATLVHTAAQLAAMALAALAVYRLLGVAVLNRVWINQDLIWPAALALTGLASLVAGAAPRPTLGL